MPVIKTIICDMDSVLCDLNTAVEDYHGIKLEAGHGWGNYPDFTPVDYSQLPRTEYFHSLYSKLLGLSGGGYSVWLATCCPQDKIGARLDWIRDNMPEFRHRVIFCPDKQVLSHRHALLIDDRPPAHWEGPVVRVPALWQSDYPQDNFDIIEKINQHL